MATAYTINPQNIDNVVSDYVYDYTYDGVLEEWEEDILDDYLEYGLKEDPTATKDEIRFLCNVINLNNDKITVNELYLNLTKMILI